MKVQRALLSVYDKAGLVDLGRALADLGVELIGSGSTTRTCGRPGAGGRGQRPHRLP